MNAISSTVAEKQCDTSCAHI